MSLLKLPTEIMLEIQTCLSYGSCVALRLTCRELYAKVEDPNGGVKQYSNTSASWESETKPYGMEDLLEIERWPEYNGAAYELAALQQPLHQRDFFACSYCLKIRSAIKFSNAMMKGKRGKLGNGTVAERTGRFCIQCGLTHGRYQRGVSFSFGGVLGGYGFACLECGIFEHVQYGSEALEAQGTCTSCWFQRVANVTTATGG